VLVTSIAELAFAFGSSPRGSTKASIRLATIEQRERKELISEKNRIAIRDAENKQNIKLPKESSFDFDAKEKSFDSTAKENKGE
jgi:hypothetical protein